MLESSLNNSLVAAPKERASFKTPSVAELRGKIPLALDPLSLPAETVDGLLEKIKSLAIPVHSEYFMNQLFSGISPEAVKAQAVVASTKATMSTFEASTIFSLIELEVIAALGQLLAWDSEYTEGLSVPGGTSANFMAIHCARQQKFPDSKAKGNQGRDFKIFVSEHSHYSWKKACLSLGLGVDNLVDVKTDGFGQMDINDLKEKISVARKAGGIPLLVGATAGTTVYGAFDPLAEIYEICAADNIWFHVDGAWGGPVLFSRKHKNLIKGIEWADSVTFDAHKLLGTSLTCSFFLTRKKGILLEANDVNGADYLFHEQGEIQDRGKIAWQCGRPADALGFWAIWKRQGTLGLGEFVDRLIHLKEEFVTDIKTHSRLRLIMDPAFLNVCVQVIPPSENIDPLTWSKMVRDHLKKSDQVMVNYSTDENGLTFIRFILAHPDLKIDQLKDMLQRALRVTPADF